MASSELKDRGFKPLLAPLSVPYFSKSFETTEIGFKNFKLTVAMEPDRDFGNLIQ